MEPASEESEDAKQKDCVEKYKLDIDNFVNFSIDTIEELDFSEWPHTDLLEITRQMTLRIRSATAVVDVVNRQMEKNETQERVERNKDSDEENCRKSRRFEKINTQDYAQGDVEKSSKKKRKTEDSTENNKKRAKWTDESETVSAVLEVEDVQMHERITRRTDYCKDKELAWKNGENYRQEHHNDWNKKERQTEDSSHYHKTNKRKIAAETKAIFIPKPRGPEGCWRTHLPETAS